MRKRLLFTFLLFSLFQLKAQQYVPLLDSINRWTVVANWIPVRISSTYSLCTYPFSSFGSNNYFQTDGDTNLNNVIYKKVMITDQFSTCLAGFLREDTSARKVYFVNTTGGSDELIYDFSLNAGDSLSLNFFQSGFFSSGNFTVDSISTVTITAGLRRIFYLTNHARPAYSLEWIEGVGSPEHPFYTYSENSDGGLMFSFCTGNQYYYGSYLSCFYHSSNVYFDECAYNHALIDGCFMVNDSCNYGNICGNISENSMIKNISFSPNPTHAEITIEVDVLQSAEYVFQIYNIDGRIATSTLTETFLIGRNSRKINVSSLANGTYFLECRSKEGSVFRKLLIQ